jgi:hypothetical protein
MSLFSTILQKLGFSTAGSAAAAPAPDATAPPADVAVPTAAAPVSEVDVAAELEAKAAAHSETLNWRTSIVDLLKLLDMDSSPTARKALASELHYPGSTEDSAAMNIWLHKEVLSKLAENGGKVPKDLLH